MRWILRIPGVLAALIGIIRILQGLDRLGGSAMSGHSQWAWTGIGTLVVGLGLVYRSFRRLGLPQ